MRITYTWELARRPIKPARHCAARGRTSKLFLQFRTTQYRRNAMLGALEQDYIRMARVKGLKESRIT